MKSTTTKQPFDHIALAWRRVQMFVALAATFCILTETAVGQMTPPESPLPWGSQTAPAVIPLPLTAVNPAPPMPALSSPIPTIGNATVPSNTTSWTPKNYVDGGPPAGTTSTQTWGLSTTSSFDTPGVSLSGDPLQQPAIVPPEAAKLVQSSWYTRIDYFHWNEHIGSMDFVNESGALYTLGYLRRFGQQRLRAELFGGSMIYDGGLQFDDGTSEPMTSRTRYLGGLVEAEYLLEPSWWPNAAFFLGIGSRFWIRDIRSGFGSLGDFADETQETWWTLYPYLGLQNVYPLQNGLELYSSMRVGATAVTYNFSNAFDLPIYPRPGAIGNVELGLRGTNLSVAGTFGIMSWSHSAKELFSTTDGSGNFAIGTVWQPSSTLITVGGKVAYSF